MDKKSSLKLERRVSHGQPMLLAKTFDHQYILTTRIQITFLLLDFAHLFVLKHFPSMWPLYKFGVVVFVERIYLVFDYPIFLVRIFMSLFIELGTPQSERKTYSLARYLIYDLDSL